jgi:hypothetical protein
VIFSEDDLESNWCWLAVDAHNHIGLFQSFGDGALLPAFTRSVEDAEFVQDYVLEKLLEQLGGFCEGKLVRDAVKRLPIRPKSPLQTPEEAKAEYESALARDASCGIFVFNAALSSHRPVGCLKLAYPSKPRSLNSFPPEVENKVGRFVFPSVDFSAVTELLLEDFMAREQNGDS